MADSIGLGTPITPASAIEQRSYTGMAPAQGHTRHEHNSGQAAFDELPTQLAIGTVINAILRVPKRAAMRAGTMLKLRIVALDAQEIDLLTGVVVDVVNEETLVSTPLGLLAMQRRLRLPPDTPLAFVVVEVMQPADENRLTPARDGSWAALEEALLALSSRTPAVADQLRDELTPHSGHDLAGTLLFMIGALYRGRWPHTAITHALAELGHAKLAMRLADDILAMRKLGDDPRTGDWRVVTLPMLQGNFPLSLRLYLNRRRAAPKAQEENTRFVLEVELSRLGPMQLDGILRGKQLILVLRSYKVIEPELRQTLKAVFARALSTAGLNGDLSFSTAAQFLVRPLEQLRERVAITA